MQECWENTRHKETTEDMYNTGRAPVGSFFEDDQFGKSRGGGGVNDHQVNMKAEF